MNKRETQIIGNVGMYYACYRLSMLGWNVMPTSRNARGVDIIAYDNNAEKFVAIQVKTLSNRSPVPLGQSLEKIMGDWWIIVNEVADHSKQPNTYILLPDEVRNLAHRGEKDGRVSYWLQPKDYTKDEFIEKWDRIASRTENGCEEGKNVQGP